MRYHGGEMAIAAYLTEPSPFWAYMNPERAAAEFDARQKKYRALAVPASREGRPRPERSDYMDMLSDAIKNTYGAKLWWSCNGYKKLEDNHGRVWIMPPSREVEVGSGNAARRRLGQTWAMEPDPDACPCRRGECACSESCCPSEKGVWRNANGTLAEEW